MTGAALGLVTALALSAAAPQELQRPWANIRFGARGLGPAAQPGVPTASAAQSLELGTPPPVCHMPVIHGDTAIDAKFVVPVPKGKDVPRFTMRWAPSRPCDPALESPSADAPGTTPPRR